LGFTIFLGSRRSKNRVASIGQQHSKWWRIQINDGIKAMMANGKFFKTGSVDEWMDCGNKGNC
jgi:hypothetical protein